MEMVKEAVRRREALLTTQQELEECWGAISLDFVPLNAQTPEDAPIEELKQKTFLILKSLSPHKHQEQISKGEEIIRKIGEEAVEETVEETVEEAGEELRGNNHAKTLTKEIDEFFANEEAITKEFLNDIRNGIQTINELLRQVTDRLEKLTKVTIPTEKTYINTGRLTNLQEFLQFAKKILSY
jgi:hypothetical protein